MKVALYARVSTNEQDCENQLIQLREWAKRGGHEIYAEYSDQGISGTKESRPAFDQLLLAMRQYKFNAIAVVKIDRLGRSMKHIFSLFDEFKNKGVAVIATTQPIDTSDTNPYGKIVLAIMGAFAEIERDMISERTKAARARKPTWGKRGPDRKPRKKRGGFRKPYFYPNEKGAK